MFDAFRAGGLAAAFLMLASLIAAPALASTAPAPGVAPAAAVQAPVMGPATPIIQPIPASPSTSPTQARSLIPAAASTPKTPNTTLSLSELVLAFVDYGNQDAEQECLAGAIYFEARSEPLEGQLAVAQVVLNRAASGVYPSGICDVVTQPAQFSFIRNGKFPPINKASDAWHKALAIADVARRNLVQKIASNVLWYHANYVAPSWGRRLTRAAELGRHIFYR